jgi:hypothetical protein
MGWGVHQVPLVDPAEDFGIPVWSPDRSKLLISNLNRFDASGDSLPFRPATVHPDGSDFKVLDPPKRPVRYVLRDLVFGRRPHPVRLRRRSAQHLQH